MYQVPAGCESEGCTLVISAFSLGLLCGFFVVPLDLEEEVPFLFGCDLLLPDTPLGTCALVFVVGGVLGGARVAAGVGLRDLL